MGRGQTSYCTNCSKVFFFIQLLFFHTAMNDKDIQVANEKEFMLAVAENTLADMVDSIPAAMTQNLPLGLDSPSREKQCVEGLNCGVEVSIPGQNDRLVVLPNTSTREFVFGKHANSDVSLQQVLSDSISGNLMEDAMVMPCGHSFGISGLLHVKETNLCLTCGAPVPANSMIPNYALRSAVLAYKCECGRRKGEMYVQVENDGKRLSRAFADPEAPRPRGVQFPYVANDRVLIKGNKRTPERFVGREAIITTQCLNGWYLVKTLDTGESVRLQYRSLLKLGDKETTTEVSREKLTDENCNDALKGPFISACCISLSADNEDGFPPNSNDRIDANTTLCGVVEGPTSQSLGRANQNSQRSRRRNQVRVTDTFGASWHSGRTSSYSSQDLQVGQVHGKCTQEAATLYDSADEDQRAIKRIAAIGATGPVIEGITLQSNCSAREHSATQCNVPEAEKGCAEADLAGESVPRNTPLGSKCQGKRPRPKHFSSQFHKGLSPRSDLQEADPYKKVYLFGRRRGANNVNSHGFISRKQSAFVSPNSDFDHCGALPVEEHQEADVKTSGESSSYQSAVSFCEILKRRMLDLETDIPWSCMQNNWKEDHAVWLDMLHKSSSLKDVAKRLEELRRALILEKAGNMSDTEWNRELEAAVEHEAVEAVDYLWRRLHDDISKLLVSKLKRDRKPLNNIEVEFLELKSHFPQLCIGGLSRVGVTAATSMAAAEAYAVGERDIETLLTIPMKLIQQHNIQDLQAVIDVIEREKRHLSAKILNLCSGGSTYGKSNAEDLVIENPNHQVRVSPTSLGVESEELIMSELGKESTRTDNGQRMIYDEEPVLVDADTQEKDVMPTGEIGEEETDLSDSD